MIYTHSFIFNPYQENTYVLYDDTGICAIIDPGMYGSEEEQQLATFIADKQLRPQILLNTHCHIDHVLGNRFVFEEYGLLPNFHENEIPLLMEVVNYAPQMGFRYDPSPIPETFLPSHGSISFGDNLLEIKFVPGHSPGHICFYSVDGNFLIGGDALFRGSIGRTDLPGGNHTQLIESIQATLYTLPQNVTVYPGHGPATTFSAEMNDNPFVRA